MRQKQESQEKEPDVVLIGDSIISYFSVQPIWNDLFAPLHCLNMGIGGDRTEHVLWRIKDGVLSSVKPKAVVVHIGTNNTDCRAQDVAAGIIEIVKQIREILPETYVIVTSILPRGQHINPLRTLGKEINQVVESKLSAMPQAEFMQIGSSLLQADGSLNHHDAYDYLHLTDSGYRKSFGQVHAALLKILAKAEPHKV